MAATDAVLQELLAPLKGHLLPRPAIGSCHSLAHAGPELPISSAEYTQILRKVDAALPQAAAQLSKPGLRAALDVLCSVLLHLPTADVQQSAGTSTRPKPPLAPVNQSALENSCLTLQAVGTLSSKVFGDPALLQKSGQAVLATLEHAIKSSSQGAKPAERLYLTALRTLNSILMSNPQQHGLNLIECVEALRQCFTFGVEFSLSAASAPGTALASGSLCSTALQSPPSAAGSSSARYRPPHARRRSSSNAGWSDASDVSRSGSESGSDSDSSRSSRGSISHKGRASAVRLAALSCLQTLIKADSRALHPHWPVLLPVYSPLQTKYHAATLMDAIVRDPVPKVRASAAAALSSMLEGPAQKAYLNVAEAKSAARPPVRGFTTLSTTLGHLVIALHDGLLHAVSTEASTAPLINILKALQTLMASAAYSRLPTDLLPRCIEAISRRLQAAGQKVAGTTALDAQAVQAAACACLAAAFGTKTSFESVAGLLKQSSPATSGGSSQVQQTLLELCLTGNAAVRTEALAALTGLAKNYPEGLLQSWAAVSLAVATSLNGHQKASSSPAGGSGGSASTSSPSTVSLDAKCAQQAMRLLTSFLTASNQVGDSSIGEKKQQRASTPVRATDSPTSHVAQQQQSLLMARMDPAHPSLLAVSSNAAPSSMDSCQTTADSVVSQASTGQDPAGGSVALDSALKRQACAGMWREACEQHVDKAVKHDSPLVRTAAQACVSECTYTFRQLQPPQLQKLLWQWAWAACATDDAAAVTAAAAKTLGRLAEGPAAGDIPTELMTTCDVLHGAAQHQVLSVRIAVLSTVANLTDSLRHQHAPLQASSVPALKRLTAVAIMARSDNDKVIANVVRALGNLFAIRLSQAQLASASAAQTVSCSLPHFTCTHEGTSSNTRRQHDDSSCCQAELWWGAKCWEHDWLQQASECLLKSLSSQTEKVQWNACYATGSLLQNPDAAALASNSSVLQQILACLLDLMRSSPSYKVRGHAAAALSSLKHRTLYGDLWAGAVKTVACALADLQGSDLAQHGSEFTSKSTSLNYQSKDSLLQHLRAYHQVLLSMMLPDDPDS